MGYVYSYSDDPQAICQAPTKGPTAAPTETPTKGPTAAPTETPTAAPTEIPECPTACSSSEDDPEQGKLCCETNHKQGTFTPGKKVKQGSNWVKTQQCLLNPATGPVLCTCKNSNGPCRITCQH